MQAIRTRKYTHPYEIRMTLPVYMSNFERLDRHILDRLSTTKRITLLSFEKKLKNIYDLVPIASRGLT